MTIKPLTIAAKIIFISRKINLNIQNLKIVPYNKKKKCKFNMVCYFCNSVYIISVKTAFADSLLAAIQLQWTSSI